MVEVTDHSEKQQQRLDCDLRAANTHQQRVLALIDVLGFSNHIRRIDGDDREAEALLSIFRDLRSFIEARPEIGIELRFISDTFVIILPLCPLRDPPWRDEVPSGILALELCKTIQSGLLSLGFLSRGAIVAGNMVLRDDVLFGVALLEAHKLESQIAKYPRVLVDRTLFESGALPLWIRTGSHLIATDHDGLQFVNIFDWEWEAHGLWVRMDDVGPDGLTPLLSDEKDRDQMRGDLGFFCEAKSALERMYHEAVPIPEHRLKVEWVIKVAGGKTA
jgi:hypothetical protein